MNITKPDNRTHMLTVDPQGFTADFVGTEGETTRARLILRNTCDSVTSYALTDRITLHTTDNPQLSRNVLIEALAEAYGVKVERVTGIAALTGPFTEDERSALMPGTDLCALYDQLVAVAARYGFPSLHHGVIDCTEDENAEV
ncbi:hypothetical protein ACWGCW_25955 [Streptomyces sp. NPDC054933]